MDLHRIGTGQSPKQVKNENIQGITALEYVNHKIFESQCETVILERCAETWMSRILNPIPSLSTSVVEDSLRTQTYFQSSLFGGDKRRPEIRLHSQVIMEDYTTVTEQCILYDIIMLVQFYCIITSLILLQYTNSQ